MRGKMALRHGNPRRVAADEGILPNGVDIVLAAACVAFGHDEAGTACDDDTDSGISLGGGNGEVDASGLDGRHIHCGLGIVYDNSDMTAMSIGAQAGDGLGAEFGRAKNIRDTWILFEDRVNGDCGICVDGLDVDVEVGADVAPEINLILRANNEDLATHRHGRRDHSARKFLVVESEAEAFVAREVEMIHEIVASREFLEDVGRRYCRDGLGAALDLVKRHCFHGG